MGAPVTGLFRTNADGHYHIAFPACGVEFVVDRLRRERHELFCELAVSCGIVGARVIDGVLSVGTFNLSSPSAAQQRAKLFAERARTNGLDWASMLEEVRQRVLTAERAGEPAITLRDVHCPPAEEDFSILGLTLPKAHASILFGDGGTLKSYLALKVGSELVTHGERIGLFDWELDQTTQRRRLACLNGATLPDLRYVRCDRPLVHEVDRLRRIIRTDGLTYGLFDSIGFGTLGAPESAEAAMDYCRALRQLGIGALLIAHITKGDAGDQKPFGSVFWHNSARSTWNIKLASTSPDGQTLSLAAFHRKSNLGPLQPAVGLRVDFDRDRVSFERVDVTSIDEVADSLPLWQRIRGVLRAGPQTLATLAGELHHDKPDSIDRVVRRHKQLFTKVTGADGVSRIALVERRVS